MVSSLAKPQQGQVIVASNNMDSLYTETHDLGIIGGGICGAGIARDAALRGIRVVLFEKNEFGSGTSGKSSKLIHGGIRYLELAWNSFKRADFSEAWKNFNFVFVSLRESRRLRRLAPSLVQPLELLVPIYKDDRRKPWIMYGGTVLYFILALFSGRAKFPRIYPSRAAALKALPDLDPEGLLGAVKIWDHWVDDRALVLATMESAKKSGAQCFEKMPIVHYEHDKTSNTFLLHVTDRAQEKKVRVRKLINATGPWLDKIKQLSHEKEKDYLCPVAGCHLMLNSFLPCSTLLQARDNRFFFVINHGGQARVGTTERVVSNVDAVQPTEEEIDYLLSSLNRYFPKKNFTRKDILNRDAGVRPLAAPDSPIEANKISREHKIRVSPSGCIHMIGVKLTDHRRAAEEVVDRLVPLLLPANPKLRHKSQTGRLPL